MKIRRILATGVAAAALAMIGPANADVILVSGAAGTGNNVLFGDDGPSTQIVTSTNLGDVVVFESNELLTADASGNGQCCLNAADGIFNFVEFYLQDTTMGFLQVVFNLQTNNAPTSIISVTILNQDNVAFLFENLALGSGQNFFTANASGSDIMTRVQISSSDGFGGRDLQQVRIGVTDLGTEPPCDDCEPPTSVPEPGTLGLLGLGILGLGLRRRIKV